MESYKGISGPWKVSNGNDGLFIDTDWDGEETKVEQFATIWGNNGSYIKTANLIAAAPQLLEALQKVYRLAKQIGLAEDLDFEEFDYMGSAINKALGR